MLAKLASYTLVGIDATPVEVEVDVSFSSMPKTVLVGLAETAVKESTHRVERAIVNSGYRRPIDRVVINLAPADLKKDAGGFDLPIALGLLSGSGQVAFDRPGSFAIVGELALTGETRPIKGVLAMALQAAAEKRDGLLVPAANAPEAAVVEGLNVYPDRQPGRGRRLPLRAGRHRPGVGRPRRGLPPALAHGGGLRRRQGPGLRQAGPPDRRGRRPQRPDDRPARAPARRCWPSGCRRSCRR